MNCCNNRGMSYIEVLVSAAILSVIMIPLTVGFRQTTVSYLRSQDIYLAGTNCSNILLSAERALKNGLPSSAGTIEEFLNDENFSNSYELEKFDYAIHVSEITDDGQVPDELSFSTNPGISAEADTEAYGVDFTTVEIPSFDNLIEYDEYSGNFYTSNCPYAEFFGDTCRISVTQPNVSINFDARALSSPVKLELCNNSGGILSLNIFSGENSEGIQELVEIKSSGSGNSAVCFRRLGTEKNYLLTVGVYDKNGRLLNRLAKLI